MKYNKYVIGLLLGLVVIPNNVFALSKDETVWSTLKDDGSLFKSTVVNHLYDASSDDTRDMSELKDILNVNGNESFTINGTNLVWKNGGKEIFYQGNTDKELPIKTNVKYYLDGKEVSGDAIVGKSGKVKIEISFLNQDKHVVSINGSDTSIYTPFVVTVGSVFSNKNASNIEVSNGKVVNTGSKNFIVSLASPGLYDSLGLDEFKDMDKVVISFDTDSYKKNSIYVVATPKLIDSKDMKVFDKLDNVYSNVNKLSTNMDTIETGANDLEAGALKLKDGSKEISDNLYKIANYMRSLESGTLELGNGIKQVISALDNINGNVSPSNESIQSLNTLKSYNNQSIETLNNTNNTIKTTFSNYGIDIDNVSVEFLSSNNLESLVTYKNTYDGNVKLIGLISANNKAIDSTISNSYNVANEVNVKVNSLVNELKSNLSTIESGSNKIYNSTVSIRTGIDKLYQGSISLNGGVNSLYNGTINLRNGISTYNSNGIKVMAGYANYAHTITNKLDELNKLSNQYKGFASNNSNTTTFVSVIK